MFDRLDAMLPSMPSCPYSDLFKRYLKEHNLPDETPADVFYLENYIKWMEKLIEAHHTAKKYFEMSTVRVIRKTL